MNDPQPNPTLAFMDTETTGLHPDRRMRHHGLLPSWRYHLVDVETLAAGQLGISPPWNFDGILERYGLSYSPEDRHTALGDARMVRDLYDAVILAHKPSQDTEMDANV